MLTVVATVFDFTLLHTSNKYIQFDLGFISKTCILAPYQTNKRLKCLKNQ